MLFRSGLKALKVGTPRLATIGGLPGTELDLEIAAGWTQSCSFANGQPTVALLLGEQAAYHWVMYGTEKMRLTILDGPGGKPILVAVDATEGALFDDLAVNAAPIVKTFAFRTS